MKLTVTLLLILVLVTTVSLLLVSAIASTLFPSPFLIAATIVALVALYGTILSLYLRAREGKQT